MSFRKATKSAARLRAAFYGPSGSGKTFTALRVATGFGGSIAVIDTERGSAEKYADRFEFDVCNPDSLTIDGYLAAFKEAAKAGYETLIIDSLSHAWHELLQEIDRLAATKFKGNTWSAWSEGTPKQRKLVDAILQYPGHVIATMRADTEWSQESDGRGKMRPVKVGLKPQQGKGIEYEFDLLVSLSPDHTASVEKDRTGKFQDRLIEKPGEDFGRELADWLSDGAPLAAAEKERAKRAATKATNGKVIPASEIDYRKIVKDILHNTCGCENAEQADAVINVVTSGIYTSVSELDDSEDAMKIHEALATYGQQNELKGLALSTEVGQALGL